MRPNRCPSFLVASASPFNCAHRRESHEPQRGQAISGDARHSQKPRSRKHIDHRRRGLEHLKKLTHLEYLTLNETYATEQGVAALRKALPQCYISDNNLKSAP